MLEEALVQAIRRGLFSKHGSHVYALLDGASVPDLLERLKVGSPQFCCLYRGDLGPDLAKAAPYVVRLTADHPFTDWVIREGFGHHWGVFAVSAADLRPVRNHLQQFVKVEDPKGKTVFFRFYDPRVLRIYLPTCNGEEADLFFGPVDFFATEDAEPEVFLTFFPRRKGVLRQAISLTFGRKPARASRGS